MNTPSPSQFPTDTTLYLREFLTRSRRSMFLIALANRVPPALLTAALVSFALLLARCSICANPLLRAGLLILALMGFASAMEMVLPPARHKRPFANESTLRRIYQNPPVLHLAIAGAAAVSLGAWLMLPPWAMIVVVITLCLGLIALNTPIKSTHETAWILDYAHRTSGTLITALDQPSPASASPMEDLFRGLVRQNATLALRHIRIPQKIHAQQNRVIVAVTGFTTLAIALILLIGPPLRSSWKPWVVANSVPAKLPVDAGHQPVSIHSATVPYPQIQPKTSAPHGRSQQPNQQPGHAHPSPVTSASAQSHSAAAVQKQLWSNPEYRKITGGSRGTATGKASAQIFSHLTARQKQALAADIRSAEQMSLDNPKLLANLQKLAAAATGPRAATFSLALQQTRRTIRQQLMGDKSSPPPHLPPRGRKSHNSSGANPVSHSNGNSSGGSNLPSGLSRTPDKAMLPMNSPDITVLHVPGATTSQALLTALRQSATAQQTQHEPARYRGLIRRYFGPP